ncbi:unnamed protein product [Closterium sp. NIES-54]
MSGLAVTAAMTHEGWSKASRRRDTKNLLKQGNEVQSRPHSATKVNSFSSSCSSASRASSLNSSASIATASNFSSSRLRRVSSFSAPNTTCLGSSRIPGTSTSRSDSRSTYSNTSSSSNSSTSSSSSSIAKACAQNKPLTQLLQR